MNRQHQAQPAEQLGVYGKDKVGRLTITYTRRLPHPIDKVWQAITDPVHRAAWFPELTLEPRLGAEALVDFSHGDCPPTEEDPGIVSFCTIIAFEPPRLLEYNGPGEHHRFELTPSGEGCTLVFQSTLPDIDAFDDSGNVQSRYSVACGWHYKLDMMAWSLDGIEFEDEGYAGPIKTRLYFAYREQEKR